MPTLYETVPVDVETLSAHVTAAFDRSSHLIEEVFEGAQRETRDLFVESEEVILRGLEEKVNRMRQEVRMANEVEEEEEEENEVEQQQESVASPTSSSSFMSSYFQPEGVVDYAVGPRGGEVYKEPHLTSQFFNASAAQISVRAIPELVTHNEQVDSALDAGKTALKRPLQILNSAWNKLNVIGRGRRMDAARNTLIAYTPPVRDEFYAFSGSQGRVSVRLFAPIEVREVQVVFVMDAHRPLGVSEHNMAAPKEIRLTGWTKDPRHSRHQDFRSSENKFDLGTFTFVLPEIESFHAADGQQTLVHNQSFIVPQTERVRVPAVGAQQHEEDGHPLYEDRVIPALRAVTVEVLSNQGNEEYTALHRVRVMGELVL